MTSNDGNSKEEEITSLVHPSGSAKEALLSNEENLGTTASEDMLSETTDSLSAMYGREQLSVSQTAIGSREGPTAITKSITGLTIPHFVHPQSGETQIRDETPAEDLPEGWYHFDNGCCAGNIKIPQHDVEYERQLQKHKRWTSDNEGDSFNHRLKAALEKDAYDRCFLVYRAHVARSLDTNRWNKDNIKEHPAYENEWPWALLTHPSEGWDTGYHESSRDCPLCEDYSR